MTKVYVLVRHVHYENRDITGVFSSMELAKKALAEEVEGRKGTMNQEKTSFEHPYGYTDYIETHGVQDD